MAGTEGGGHVNVQGFDRFNAAEVMADLRSFGGIVPVVNARDVVSARELRAALGSWRGELVRPETMPRLVLFMDGRLAGERRTVPVDEHGVWSGWIQSGGPLASAYYQVEYRVEEVRLGFGDTVFLGFVPADERPSWPQRVADALAFIEAETTAEAERERLRAEAEAEKARALERHLESLAYRERQRYCRHHRVKKLNHATPEDPHRYRAVCRDCDWSVEFEGPDTCASCRYTVPYPHPDRPDTAWVFCGFCGSQHEVSLETQRAMNLRG